MVAAPSNERLFPRLSTDEMTELSAYATCRTFSPGQFVLRYGQADIDLFVVERGRIDIINPRDPEQLVASHGEGEFVGDIDLLTRRPIVVDAIARGDGAGGPTRVLCVAGPQVREVLNRVPRLSEKLIEAIQARREVLGGSASSVGIRVIGPGGCGDTNRVREFLHKNFVPFTWIDSEQPSGAAALRELPPGRKLPAVDVDGRTVLRCPSLAELAKAAGVWRGCPAQEVDLVVVGAGPAGLAAAVYAASEGLCTLVLDRLGPGGQAGGSSRIENFIGFPSGLSGTDLATRGVLQMLKFGAQMIAPVSVDHLEPADPTSNDCHKLHLDCGTTVRAKVVLASTGVTWRRLPADGAQRFERAGVYYACTAVEARLHDQADVAVVGGGNSAGQAAMFLAERRRDRVVHLLVRRHLGPGMSDYLVARIRATANIRVHEGVEVSAVRGERRIEQIELSRRESANAQSLQCGAVFVFIGAEPRSEWLPPQVARDAQGYVLTGADALRSGNWPLSQRDPCPLETTVPRVLAGGDLRAGSTKRVGFAVGDGSLAVTCVHKLRAGL